MAIHPEAVDLSLLGRTNEQDSGGRLALGDDAGESTAEKGKVINERIVEAIGKVVDGLEWGPEREFALSYEETEKMWEDVLAKGEWFSNGMRLG